MLRSLILSIGRNRRGNVALIFAFALLPILVAVGSAIDYSEAARSRNHLATSADAAALAALKAAQNYMNNNGTNGTAFAAASALAQVAMSQTFSANQTSDGYSQNVTASLAMTQATDGSPVATVTTTGNAPTFFMKLVGIPSVAVGSVSQAKGGGIAYYQIIFLVDVSSSMAIGGTSTDITNISKDVNMTTYSVNANGCGFACHDPNGTSTSDVMPATTYCEKAPLDYFCRNNGASYCPTGKGSCAINSPSSFYADKRNLARLYGYKLKIDYVNDAVSSFITSLQSKMTANSNNYSASIYTFGTAFSQLQAPTTDWPTLNAASGKIDVETAAVYDKSQNGNQGYSFIDTGFSQLMSNLQNVGDGSTPTKRQTFVIFISDGVQDDIGNLVDHRTADYNYAASCAAIKNAGVTMFSIETSYPVVPTNQDKNSQYAILVGMLPSRNSGMQISDVMKACASSTDKYFQASDGPGIQAASNSVFSSISTATLRLTK